MNRNEQNEQEFRMRWNRGVICTSSLTMMEFFDHFKRNIIELITLP